MGQSSARAYLREGMFVLALPWRASTGASRDEHGFIAAIADGVKGGIEALVAQGILDRERIGILGWSPTGVRVPHLIAFTDTPIRAATVLDGDANTLYSMTITHAFTDGTLKIKEETNQSGSFGDSRERWIRSDPSLYTDCIRAALRIESYGAYAKNNSDIYALRRRQYRPVEMLKFPEGAHALSRPSERMISLQWNVDWYRFWLKGERRQVPVVPGETTDSLQDQYRRWEQMAVMKAAIVPQLHQLVFSQDAGAHVVHAVVGVDDPPDFDQVDGVALDKEPAPRLAILGPVIHLR